VCVVCGRVAGWLVGAVNERSEAMKLGRIHAVTKVEKDLMSAFESEFCAAELRDGILFALEIIRKRKAFYFSGKPVND
jgi:hypothetical protein